MRVREYLDVIIDKHPYAESLNKKLLKDAENLSFYSKEENTYYTNLYGYKCSIKDDELTSNMRLIVDWVESLLVNKWPQFREGAVLHNAKPHTNIWFAKYNKGDYAIKHDHKVFALYAFVYFLKSPKGSSPLVFTTTGKRIKAEDGKVLIFPSTLFHHVPINKCDDRMVIAGNIGLVKE